MTTFSRSPQPTNRRTALWVQRLALGLTVGFVLLYLYSSLIPFHFDWSGCRWDRVSWLPFQEGPANGVGMNFSVSNALVNWGAGLPLGWFAFLACPRRWSPLLAWLAAVAVSGLTGLGMEILQLLVPGREVSMTDVVNIGLGGGCGALAAWCVGRQLQDWLTDRAMPMLRARPERLTLVLVLGFLALRSLFPSSVVTSLGDLKETVARANLIPGEFPRRNVFAQLKSFGFDVRGDEGIVTHPNLTGSQYGCSMLGHVLLYAMVGGALQSLRRPGGWLAVPLTGLAVGLLAATMELLQLFFPGQSVDINASLAGLAGGWLGAAAVVALAGRGDSLRLACLLAFVAYVASQYLRPGDPWPGGLDWHFDYGALIPLYHYWVGANQVDIFLDVIQGVGLFVPIGWLLAQWAHQHGRPASVAVAVAVLSSVLLALVFEVLQAGLARVPSIDDVIWAGLGGYVGCWLQARAA